MNESMRAVFSVENKLKADYVALMLLMLLSPSFYLRLVFILPKSHNPAH